MIDVKEQIKKAKIHLDKAMEGLYEKAAKSVENKDLFVLKDTIDEIESLEGLKEILVDLSR